MTPATTDSHKPGRTFMRRVIGQTVTVACLAFGAGFAWWLTPRWDMLRTEDQTIAVLAFGAFAAGAWLAWVWGRRSS